MYSANANEWVGYMLRRWCTRLHMIQCDATAYTARDNPTLQPVLFLLRLPTCAWKPVLIAFTERLEPHGSQDMKNIRFSFVRSVSGDLHVLQVTYSTAEGGVNQALGNARG